MRQTIRIEVQSSNGVIKVLDLEELNLVMSKENLVKLQEAVNNYSSVVINSDTYKEYRPWEFVKEYPTYNLWQHKKLKYKSCSARNVDLNRVDNPFEDNCYKRDVTAPQGKRKRNKKSA